MNDKKYKILNGSVLKWIAVITMLIDHIGASFVHNNLNYFIYRATYPANVYRIYDVLRGVGRIAFPIFCFLIVEGFVHTSNLKKYMLLMTIFGVISEIPFDLAIFNAPFYPEYQNVYFTLLIGIMGMYLIRTINRSSLNELLKYFLIMLSIASCCAIAWVFKTDYSIFGVMLILVMYIFRDYKLPMAVTAIIMILVNEGQIWGVTGVLLCLLYNGKRGRQHKYFFYAFYPVHLLLLYLAGMLLR